ncbi:MAG: hypothetical protein RIT81_32050 [Deltaproteobacteria bacterium]
MKEKINLGLLVVMAPLVSCGSHEEAPDGVRAKMSSVTGADTFCHAWIVGNDANGNNVAGPLRGDCSSEPPVYFSVTHERADNTHFGDDNYRPEVRTYMSDYHPSAVGQWLKLGTSKTGDAHGFAMALDTLNYEDTTPTGRSIKDGFLFFGYNDTRNADLDVSSDLYLNFRFRIRGADIGGGTAGPDEHRVILGASVRWSEPPPRVNQLHFLEINIWRTSGFHAVQNARARRCPSLEVPYDFCFYDTLGRYAEGQYIALEEHASVARVVPGDAWTEISVPLTRLVRTARWHHPPASWSSARLTPYFGLESQGASRLWVEVDGYAVTSTPRYADPFPNRAPPAGVDVGQVVIDSGYPWGLFRQGSGGFVGKGTTHCVLTSGAHLQACGYDQADYNAAPQVHLSTLASRYDEACDCSTNGHYGFFRDGVGGYVAVDGGYCSLSSGAHLVACGFSQADYNAGPVLPRSSMGRNRGACICD